MTLGQNIARLRTQKNLSQGDLADALEVSRQSVSKWETGEALPETAKLAALGAAMFYLTGYEQWQCTASSVPGMGFSGIAAAFLGGLHPIGTILASFFIQHITAGGAYVDKTMYCAQISDLIAAVIIYLCGFVLFMKYAMNNAIARREEKAIQKAKAAEQAAVPTDSADKKGGDQ